MVIPLNRGFSKCYGVQLFWRAQWLSGQLLSTSYIFSSFLFIATHILPNISKSNEIWSVKRIQHKKYFFLKSCDAETSPRPLFKKSYSRISLDQEPYVLRTLFFLYVQVQGYWDMKLRCRPLALISCIAFSKKQKEVWN